MSRVDLDQQLNILEQEVGLLAGDVESAITRAVDSLKRRDLAASQQVVDEDDYIDQKRFDIEDRCVDLIATQIQARPWDRTGTWRQPVRRYTIRRSTLHTSSCP